MGFKILYFIFGMTAFIQLPLEPIGALIKSQTCTFLVALRSQEYLARVGRLFISADKRISGKRDILLIALNSWSSH